MSLYKRVINRIKRDYFKFRYLESAKQVLETSAIPPGSDSFILLSMVHQRDVLSYLVAVKSFIRYANPQRVVVVCDPSIDDTDRQVLKSHIPHIELRHADEFTHECIPRGGCWERLFAITEYVGGSYVVQMDADTIATAPITEVKNAIDLQVGFVLGEESGQGLLTLPQTSGRAKHLMQLGAHIQTRTEAIMSEVGLPADSMYVRGCAGFTGFPPNTCMRQRMLDFSSSMRQRLGADWATWGTEQVASNFLVANSRGVQVLPFPRYATPDVATSTGTCFIHFIGPYRFTSSMYQRQTKELVASLLRRES